MRVHGLRRIAAAMLTVAGMAAPLSAQSVTDADLAKGLSDPSRWLIVSGDYTGQRLSPLTQITPANASQLAPLWTFQAGVTGQFEATPVVLDGVLYVTGPQNHAWAIDGKTGKQIWHYQRVMPAGLKVCCGPVNRGFAVYGNRLFMATLDAHLIALDPKDGKVVWDVELADYKLGHASTVAPLVVKDKLIVGMAGGEYANRGFIDAYEPETGKRVWRFWTIPAPGEPGSETWPVDVLERGGSPTWVTGTYDAELNTVYWGTGNPNPDWDGDSRPGDNLYAASVVALDPDTGTLKWHYQYTPHDTHDWDANQTPVLADLTINGQAAQSADAGEPQRVPLRARSHERQVHQRVGIRQPELGLGLHAGRAPHRDPRTHARPRKAPSPALTGMATPTSCRRPSTRSAGCSSSPSARPARSSSRRQRQMRTSAIGRWAARLRRKARPAARSVRSIR